MFLPLPLLCHVPKGVLLGRECVLIIRLCWTTVCSRGTCL